MQGRQRKASTLCILRSFGVSCSVFPCESSSPSCLPCRCHIDECSRPGMDGRTAAGAATSRARRRPAYSVCVRVEIPSVWIGVGLAVDCSINRGQGRRRPVKRIRPGPLRRIRVPRRRRRLLFPSSLRALGRQQIRLNASHGNDECTAVGSASKLRGCGAARPARPPAARRDRVTFDHLAAVAARARRPRIDRSRSHSRVTVYNDMMGVGAMVT